MDEENSVFIALAVVALVAVVGVGLAMTSFAAQQSLTNMMGGNRGSGMDRGRVLEGPWHRGSWTRVRTNNQAAPVVRCGRPSG